MLACWVRLDMRILTLLHGWAGICSASTVSDEARVNHLPLEEAHQPEQIRRGRPHLLHVLKEDLPGPRNRAGRLSVVPVISGLSI